MRVLGIESSGLTASAAIVEDGVLKGEFTVNNKLTHSETLLPMIREMCSISGIGLDTMDLIAVSYGPGSFTGLRIGIATAKGLALSYNIPAAGVSTLDSMGLILSRMTDAAVCPLMDARRGQTYSAVYHRGELIIKRDAYDIHELIDRLNKLGLEHGIIFVGDGFPVFSEVIKGELKQEFTEAGPAFNRQRAVNTAEIGSEMFEKWMADNSLSLDEVKKLGADGITCFDGNILNSDDLVPCYIRKSQAEREKELGLLEDAGIHSLKKLNKK